MRVIVLVFLLGGLVACSSLQNSIAPEDVIQLELHRPLHQMGQEIPNRKQIFALPAPAKELLRRKFRQYDNDLYGRVHAFRSWMTRKGGYRVLYDNSTSHTAAETFATGEGNCISLAILTVAFAHELRLWPQFMNPEVPFFWEQREGIELVNGHINVVVRAEPTSPLGFFVDFDPRSTFSYRDNKKLSIQKTINLFYHNRAVEALARADYELAYSYAYYAVQMMPNEASNYSLLGVVLRRQGMLQLAEQSYLKGLQLDDDHPFLLHNLVYFYRSNGEPHQAEPYLARLAKHRIRSPFVIAKEADELYQQGKFQESLALYNKAIRKADYIHDFYFGKAKALVALGEFDSAEKALLKAKAKSITIRQGELYQGKLTALAALH